MNISPVPQDQGRGLWKWLVETREELLKSLTLTDINSWLAGKTTDDLTEGSNLYFTTARAEDAISSYLTADIIESFNLNHSALTGLGDDDHSIYHTDARADTWLSTKTADDITEGGTNKYFTNEKCDDRVSNLMQNGTGLTWTYNDVANTLTPDVSLTPFNTDQLSEGSTNLYFTDERVDDRVSALIQNSSSIAWSYNDAGNTLIGTVIQAGVDHGSISGLSDDDHTQYYLADGTRTLGGPLTQQTGAVIFNNGSGDYDFTIKKNTSGDAYIYDAGADTHTFSGKVTNSPSNNTEVFGNTSGATTTTGLNCTFLGYEAGGLNITSGNHNTGVGSVSLYRVSSGVNNCAFGSNSAPLLTTGGGNVAIGYRSLDACQTGSNNVAIGLDALGACTTNANTAIGTSALASTTTGTFNVSVGGNSMFSNLVGAQCVAIGHNAGYSANVTGCVYIGYESGKNNTTANTLWISNSNTATPLIYGSFSDPSLKITGSLEFTKAFRTSAVETITASSDTLDETNHVVLCDCTSNAITINLPTAVGNTGLKYVIKKTDSSVNAVTVDGATTETIDGSTTAVLSSQYDAIQIVSDGTEWWIV